MNCFAGITDYYSYTFYYTQFTRFFEKWDLCNILMNAKDALFKDLGTDTTTAIRMFLTQAVATNEFPFEKKRQVESNTYAPMNEKEILAKLKKFGEQEIFRNADDMISDMRSKYGL